ncbi:hypothetical protein QX201_002471 [Fusarium graminearum]|uniref:Uncharacterized protein n=1 Tax=Gibberella zeae TaxID=5518 RepID=A0A9N8NB74_GIBZA|nr:unnamed protein product [Fusarium graminearum]CAF3612181.1 unnamed protein product [Fusarium graminearum]CAG1964221.1 unnamed protein product [Fusarium graminearum]
MKLGKTYDPTNREKVTKYDQADISIKTRGSRGVQPYGERQPRVEGGEIGDQAWHPVAQPYAVETPVEEVVFDVKWYCDSIIKLSSCNPLSRTTEIEAPRGV